ncbi:MAG: UDP-N-acetylmuramate--L-alanine ligase [Patescibacteria group bacterium]
MPFLSSFSHVHCVGIGGIGVSGVARFCKAHGKGVSGSDIVQSELTDQLVRENIEIHIGESDASWIPAGCDLLVYSEAVPETAPERVEAAMRGIRQLGHFGFMGELSKDFRTICISGTNGKSTTTAMTGKIFEAAKLDPTVFVGSLVPGWEMGNVRVGESNILIIEGDEYKKKMLALYPEVTLITNIEADHLDVYKDLADIENAFHQLCEQTTGVIFLNPVDAQKGIVCGHEKADPRLYGEALHHAVRHTSEGVQSLAMEAPVISWLPFFKRHVGDLRLQVPGEFNMMNALGAVAIADVFGISFDVMQKALEDFTGIWRRFERVGEFSGAIVVSDYAHHPTAIKGTLAAAKEFFPGKRIVALFEPHQHSRTKELFNDFVTSFDDADVLVLSEVYGVAGRTEEKDRVSSLDLLNAIEARLPAGDPRVGLRHFVKDLEEAEKMLREIVQQDDVVLIMGAGNVDKVARNLVRF